MNPSPRCIAHFGIRTRHLREMVHWYLLVLDGRIQYENHFAAFLTFDEEHHRLAIWSDEATVDRDPNASCIDHLAIGLPDFGSLAETFGRLKSSGIKPSLAVNHRFTTSLYYRDPDGNELEFSVDNAADKAALNDFVRSESMAEILTPPFGDAFDPEELVRLHAAGASREEMARLGMAAALS